jgi:hypothetical protein
MSKILAAIDRKTNFVINLVAWEDEIYPDLNIFCDQDTVYEEYNSLIHPWGIEGALKIPIGETWEATYIAQQTTIIEEVNTEGQASITETSGNI